MSKILYLPFLLLATCLAACNSSVEDKDNKESDTKIAKTGNAEPAYPYQPGDDIPAKAYLEHNEMYNPEAVIPPQCYTSTEGNKNPCYVCHQSYSSKEERPNKMNDGVLQGVYAFSDVGMTNSWKNLFKNRTEEIKKFSDQDIQDWISEDNYSPLLKELSNNKYWSGYSLVKNLSYPEKAFDSQGFAKDDSHWVAFNYKPFPSAFWPTNGSTGDVMIRLSKEFRELNGEYSRDVYMANLALLEINQKDLDRVSVLTLNEQNIGKDLNGDNKLTSKIDEVIRQENYVGDANDIPLTHMLFPVGSEFLHTVRYVGVKENGEIFFPPRMKEVRYMRKHTMKSIPTLRAAYFTEAKEKIKEQLPHAVGLGDRGIDNRFGWTLNAFIEDEAGVLRQQNYQELSFCNGCHKTIGSTIDQTFSFSRKLEGARGWGYVDLKAIKDVPSINEQEGEFLTYFKRVGGGDEYRQNKEMLAKWFTSEGQVKEEAVKSAESIYDLITPSPERAIALNKAYRLIVEEQSYIFGRDAVLTPATNVLQEVDSDMAPLKAENRYQYDIRLDWQQ